jgi:hypothetical protein
MRHVRMEKLSEGLLSVLQVLGWSNNGVCGGSAFGMHRRHETLMPHVDRKTERKDHLQDLGSVARMTLKWI